MALTAAAALGTASDLLFGLDHHSPFAQLVAFRPWLLVGLGVVVVVLVLLAWRRRRLWPLAAGPLAVALVGAALVVPRAIPGPLPEGGRPMAVLVANVFEGTADVDALAATIRADRPDVVVLPESAARFRSRIEPLVAPLGYRAEVSVPKGTPDVEGVTALLAAPLGDVDVRIGTDTRRDPYLEITGGTLGALHVVAYHGAAPTPAGVPAWLGDLALLSRWCAGPTPAIVAGDFNATLDHSAMRAGMRGCADAAAERGRGLEPTWGPGPTARRWFGPQIDHVLTTAGIGATDVTVLDLPGSDHRAVLARLALPG